MVVATGTRDSHRDGAACLRLPVAGVSGDGAFGVGRIDLGGLEAEAGQDLPGEVAGETSAFPDGPRAGSIRP